VSVFGAKEKIQALYIPLADHYAAIAAPIGGKSRRIGETHYQNQTKIFFLEPPNRTVTPLLTGKEDL